MTEATNEAPAAPETATLLTDPPAAESQPDAGQAEQGAEAAAKPEEKPAEQPEGAPEAYEFTPPEGHVLDDGVIGKFSEVAKELNLSQTNAQKVLDVMAPAIAERQQAALQTMTAEWADSARADKEFGGDKLQENLGVARKALDSFGTQELRALLEESGLGNHPEIIRFMYRAGSAISGDRYVGGSPTAGKAASGPKSFNDFAATLYPNQQ